MNSEEEIENICRLCLNSTSNNNAEVIRESIEEILHLLGLKLNLNLNEKPVVCSSCSDSLRKSSEFKNVCLSTEVTITSFINMEIGVVTLLDVYRKIKENSEVIINSEDKKICRFCLKLVKNDFKSLKEVVISDMAQEYLPEINLKLSSDPVLCPICLDAFQLYVSFVSNCTIVEEEIRKYRDTIRTHPNDYIKLTDVARFSQKNLESFATSNNRYKDIKVKDCNVGSLSVDKIKTEHDEEEENYADTEEYLVPLCEVKIENLNSCNYERDKCYSQASEGPACLIKNEKNTRSEDVLSRSIKKEHPDNKETVDTAQGYFSTAFNRLETDISKEKEFQSEPSLNPLTFGQEEACITQEALKLFNCHFCLYKTKKKYDLKRHLFLHERQREGKRGSLYCTLCEYHARSFESLATHIKLHADSEDVYKCGKCPYMTKLKARIDQHQLKHPEGNKVKFECQECSFTSKYKGNLKKHKLVHKDISQVPHFQCEECIASFREKHHLNRHKLIHLNLFECEMLRCANCNFQCRTKTQLINHIRLKHTDPRRIKMYRCKTCGHTAKQKGNIKTHMLVHKDPSKVTMHKCETCGLETKHVSAFRRHVLLHAEPNYFCNDCSYSSKTKVGIARHVVRHLGQKKGKVE